MGIIQLQPKVLSGTVSVPPSKSAAHRAIICAALARGVSVLSPIDFSDDILATLRAVSALGAAIIMEGSTLTIDSTNLFHVQDAILDCGESGSTLRFFIPVCAAGGIRTVFTGRGKLPERPIGIYLDCLPEKGVTCLTEGGLPLAISGILQSGTYRIAGNVSSQFITGLLLALPLLEGDSEILLTTPAQSVGYIDMTIAMMHRFGVEVDATPHGWKIRGSQIYHPQHFTIEGDWSQAAFFMTAGALGGSITIDNLDIHSCQGDKACMDIYRRFGAKVTEENGKVTVEPGTLHGIEIDASDIPDMVPALAVTAAFAEGTTVIRGAARLRIKECDRLAAMADGLTRLGAAIHETADGLVITGVPSLRGAEVESYHDHRIVMAFAVAALRCSGSVCITDWESVRKSYPNFFEDYQQLGGAVNVIMG